MTSKLFARDLLVSALFPLLIVAAFSAKAYHIDDPAYLWTARQILKAPLDFYGFEVNWGGTDATMFNANKNPPGVSYYLALGALLFGWGEVALHLWMGLFSSLLGVTTYLLARRFCAAPLFATLITLSTPVVVVSSTTVMTDVPMLALYTLSAYLWVEGVERNKALWLFSGAACAGLAFLSKYYGITVVPLLLVYAVARRRKPGAWCAMLLIPLAIALAYLYWADRLYALNPLSDAAAYAQQAAGGDFAYVNARPLIGVVFAGGALATVGFFAPMVWRGRVLIAVGVLAAALFGLSAAWDHYFFYKAADSRAQALSFALHYAVFAWIGALVLLLAVADLHRHRDAASLVLCLWLLGAFVFATFVNWSVTARTILPMAVPAGILLARRLDRPGDARPMRPALRRWAPLLPATLLSLAVAHGDYAAAASARRAALAVAEQAHAYSGRYWFMGHWGYQYYLEEHGLKFLTPDRAVDAGDRVAVVRWLTLAPPSFAAADVIPLPDEAYQRATAALVSTHHPLRRSGFYSSVLGPLPYTLGPAPEFRVDEFEFRAPRGR